MHLSRRFRFVPSLLLLSVSATAQWSLETTVSKPAGLASGDPKGSVALDATGDGRLDLFVRFGSEIAFFDNAWQGGGGLATGVSCTDFDAAAGQGPDGVAALAFVDGTGLKLLRRNAIYSTSFAFETPTLLEAGSWAGARLVRAADLDGNGTMDYVGLKVDGRTLLLRRDTGSGPVTTEVDTSRDILDIVLINWQGSSNLEIAAQSGLGVDVRNLSLGQVDAISPAGHSTTAIARLPVPGSSTDSLAWIGTNLVSLHTDLAVLKKSAPRIDNLVELDAQDASAVRLATGNLTDDLGTDVVVQRGSGRTLWLLSNSSAGVPVFVPSTKTEIDWSSSMAYSAQPIVERFSGAKLHELLVPTYSANSAELVILRPPTSHLGSSDVIRLTPEFEGDVPPEALCLPVDSQPYQREFRVGVRFPPVKEVQDPQGQDQALRIEVTIFTAVEGANNVYNTVNQHERYWIDWPANGLTGSDFVLQGLRIYAPSGDVPENACDFAPRFFEIRQVRVNTATLTVVESGQTYTFGYCRHGMDYSTHWPTGVFEQVDLHTVVNDPDSTYFCPGGGSINPVHAQAIVARRKPNPLLPAPVLLPVPEPGAPIQ